MFFTIGTINVQAHLKLDDEPHVGIYICHVYIIHRNAFESVGTFIRGSIYDLNEARLNIHKTWRNVTDIYVETSFFIGDVIASIM